MQIHTRPSCADAGLGQFLRLGRGRRGARAAFPGGWSGGELPNRGFWCLGGTNLPDEAALIAALARVLDQSEGRPTTFA
jgi:hypothetical protein